MIKQIIWLIENNASININNGSLIENNVHIIIGKKCLHKMLENFPITFK
jgi:hypothetical protein